MVSNFQKSWTTRDEKHKNNGTNVDEIWQATAPSNADYDGSKKWWFLKIMILNATFHVL